MGHPMNREPAPWRLCDACRQKGTEHICSKCDYNLCTGCYELALRAEVGGLQSPFKWSLSLQDIDLWDG